MRELLITLKDNKKIILLLEDGVLVEKYEESGKQAIEGNIYVGKIQNILNGLQSAFVNIGEGKNAFIHVKDIVPKLDSAIEENKNTLQNLPNINSVVKTGDKIIVEVKRESTNYKGPRVSTHITLAGLYTVLMPNSPFITISQKIENKEERERLKKIVTPLLEKNMGAIIRTSAENKSDDVIKKDVKKLLSKWKEIISTNIDECPKMVYNKGGIIRKLLIDLSNDNLSRIVVENEELKNEIQNILNELEVKVKIVVKKDIIQEFFLSKQIENIENRKVYLKSGGFITIDKTEALTAIDVNSGKFIGKDNLEDTIVLVNMEAVREIAKQIRLRDIGGIIIIDFIDMFDNDDKMKIIEEMKKCIKNDRSKVQIEEFTKLNLLEITRKHVNR